MQLTNVGLGPARIVTSRVELDDRELGEFNEETINEVRDSLRNRRPHATTFRSGAVLTADYDRLLLSVDAYDPEADAELAHLLRDRLTIEFVYESLYMVATDQNPIPWTEP